jgi:Ca2+-binding EF-hand superfamily protein
MKIALVIELESFAGAEHLAELIQRFVWENTGLIRRADLLEITTSDNHPQTEVRLVRLIKHIL